MSDPHGRASVYRSKGCLPKHLTYINFCSIATTFKISQTNPPTSFTAAGSFVMK